jgi:hypothetical protein
MNVSIWWLIGAGAAAVVLVAVLVFLLLRRRKKPETAETPLYWYYQDEWLFNAFENHDVAVFGPKGSGKDATMCHVINLHGKKHYSNIRYNDLTEVRVLEDLHIGGNDHNALIKGTDRPFEANFEEECHFYISDAGVYLGCQHNKKLNDDYEEISTHVALRRHFYNSHVHTNSQALSRVWDKLREQQTMFIRCLSCIPYGEYLIVSAITYDRYESALERMPPPKNPDDADYELKYGEIVRRRFKIPIKSLTYDTRHFKSRLIKNSEVLNEPRPAKFAIGKRAKKTKQQAA